MKYLVRIALLLAIAAVGLAAFTFAASFTAQAGNGGVHAAFHCQGPDVFGTADIDSSPTPQHLECNSWGSRVMNNDPPAQTSYFVTLKVYMANTTTPAKTCVSWMTVGSHFSCRSDTGSQAVTLHLR